jgi:Flp pilus assembly protein TadD
LERGQAKKAIQLADRYTRLEPTDAWGWLILGAAYQQVGQGDKAREAFRTCVAQGKGKGKNECAAFAGGR